MSHAICCSINGCTNKHMARGMCSTHYSAWKRRQPGYVRKRYERKADIVCERCGKTKQVNAQTAKAQRYCSLICAKNKGKSTDLVIYVPPVCKQQETTIIKSPKRAFKSGQCRICSTWYVSLNNDATCSTECWEAKRRLDRRMSKDKRRAVKRAAFVANVYRRRVFESDGYRCHLCGKLCDKTKTVPHPKAPTVDHVIPLASGGTHEPSNCRTAHFRCNSRKSYFGGGDQFALDLTVAG